MQDEVKRFEESRHAETAAEGQERVLACDQVELRVDALRKRARLSEDGGETREFPLARNELYFLLLVIEADGVLVPGEAIERGFDGWGDGEPAHKVLAKLKKKDPRIARLIQSKRGQGGGYWTVVPWRNDPGIAP